MSAEQYIAVDLGAESGRVVLGTLSRDSGRPSLGMEELHRFPTGGIKVLDTLQWDVTRMYAEIIEGLRRAAQRGGERVRGVAVDTWGVDFGLVARDGSLLGNPIHYREPRTTEGMPGRMFEIVPARDFYRSTGIQAMPINTACKLTALTQAGAGLLEAADSLHMMNDVFTYLLSGVRVCEYTNASTTQLLDARTRRWDDSLIARLGLPRHLFMEPASPASVVGPLHPAVAAETGLSPSVEVLCAAGHDTACAVAAIPHVDPDVSWAFLSSGTWSLLGAEISEPVLSEAAREANFTNEGGVDGKIRFLKNISGLWLLQECRRTWAMEGMPLGYADLAAQAGASEPFRTLFDADHSDFLAPSNMPAAICTHCRAQGLAIPETPGQFARGIFESLALAYRRTLQAMDRLLGRRTERLYIVGGGVRNRLLCQMTADACGLPVYLGPSEATSLGNVILQAMACGALGSLAEARKLVAAHAGVEVIYPGDGRVWNGLGG